MERNHGQLLRACLFFGDMMKFEWLRVEPPKDFEYSWHVYVRSLTHISNLNLNLCPTEIRIIKFIVLLQVHWEWSPMTQNKGFDYQIQMGFVTESEPRIRILAAKFKESGFFGASRISGQTLALNDVTMCCVRVRWMIWNHWVWVNGCDWVSFK